MSDDLIKQMHALIESEMSYEDIYGEYIKRIKDIKKLYLDLIETIKNSWNIVMNDNRIKTLSKKDVDKISPYQKKWESLLENVEHCDTEIKHNVNLLLIDAHMVAFSDNHKNILCFENMGFSTDDGYYEDVEKCYIPMFVQIVTFDLIRDFSALLFHSFKIMALLGEISLFLERSFPSKNSMKSNSIEGVAIDISNQLGLLEKQVNGIDQMEKKFDAKLNKLLREDRFARLTQEECAFIYHGVVHDYVKQKNKIIEKLCLNLSPIKEPKKESILRKIQRWDYNQTCNKGYYPPRYSRNKSIRDFHDWAQDLEGEKFKRWNLLHNNKRIEDEQDNEENDD